ncbi:nucleoside deaminase [Salmonella enterica subsp. enterica serovar Java]|nr:nucleoside deaminase [Salmonella enterica subsp. enterica]EBU8131882.1 nucleoside deaminase [Salmonella enterica subsp. enterica serovar Java]
MSDITEFLDEAVTLAFANAEAGGRPFGAVVVKDGAVIARGVNRMLADNDPTAHAELTALQAAGAALASPRLDGCEVYASGQPCPMCMAAMRMAGVKRIGFVYSNGEAEPFGLSTADIGAELAQPLAKQDWALIEHVPRKHGGGGHLYQAWQAMAGKPA